MGSAFFLQLHCNAEVIVHVLCCSNLDMQQLLKQVRKNLEDAPSTGEHMDSNSNACHHAKLQQCPAAYVT